MKLEDIKGKIILLITAQLKSGWSSCILTYEYPPVLNRAFSGTQKFLDEDGNRVRLILQPDQELADLLYKFIVRLFKIFVKICGVVDNFY